MSKHDLTLADLDTWHGERKLDSSRSPARHAIAAWVLVAAFALAAIFGPPAGRETVAGLVALRHDVRALDRELGRVALRSRLASRGTLSDPPVAIAPFAPDQPRRARI